MRKRLSTYFFILGLCLLAKSCIKDGDLNLQNMRLSDNFIYDLPIPLVDTDLNMSDLLTNIKGQYVVADSNGLLKLVYQQEFEYDFSDLQVSIPDQVFQPSSGASITILPDDKFPADSIPITSTFWFNLSNEANPSIRIDSAYTETMDFEFFLNTTIRNKTRIKLGCPHLVDSMGTPFLLDTLLPGVRFGSQSVLVKVDMARYRIIPDNSRSYSLQAIAFFDTIIIFKDPNITAQYQASITSMSISLKNIALDCIYGYLGRDIFGPFESTMDLSILEKNNMELIEVEKAKMKCVVTNGLGLPVLFNAEISTLTHNPVTPSRTLTINEPLNYPQNPLAPPPATSFEEEIQDLISNNAGKLPYQVKYSVKVTTNPDHITTLPNFLSANSSIKMAISAEIPLRLRVGGFRISDTIKFAGLPYTDGIEFFTIKSHLHNGFPLEADISLFFLDESQQAIDSVDLSVIKGAKVDPVSGHVTQPTVSLIEANLSESQIKSLVRTRYFSINAVLNTSDYQTGTMINIYENSDSEGFLRVLLGCRLKASGKLISSFSDLLEDNKKE